MAATFLDSWKLANFVDGTVTPDAEDFRRKVAIAIIRVAKIIGGENQSSFTLQQWQKRAALSTSVLGVEFTGDPPTSQPGIDTWLDTFANGTAEVASITGASSDADIEFTVTAMWDDVAGVSGQDLT